ncbi:MAG: F0F1 ATP synthase subunit beta, partial [Clostridia bacterium]|nr:F0F1 ATP synthase subunit beta [Clostridia bacterium]
MAREGRIAQVVGPVVDVRFEEGELPQLLNAVEIEFEGRKITAEVAQHIGDSVARCVAMSGTEGLKRGVKAVDTGKPISVPVGDGVLGRIMNLLGEPV